MATGRLPKSSWVRYNKIFTLSEKIVVRYYGTLSGDVFQEVMKGLCEYLACPGL